MKRLFRIALILCLVFSCLPSVAFGGVGCQHDYSRIFFEPTCTESGFTMYLCRICGKSYRDDFVPALDHDLETRFVANGGCCGEYVEHCKRCEYIHKVSTDGHGYTYGACWFCDRQEPDAVYHSVEMPINGDQVVLAYRGYALNTTMGTVKVSVEEGAVSCPPKEAVWTIHTMGEGYVLRHRNEELRIGSDGEPEMCSLGEGSLWSLLPTGEPGEYRLYCQEKDLYLSENAKGWYTSDSQSDGEKLKVYAYCDHVLLEPAVERMATCCYEGLLQQKCVKCSACYEEVIPTESHSYKNQVCIWCGKHTTEDHIWSEPVKVTEATCTQGAREYRTCTQCGESTITVLSGPAEHRHQLLYVREASCKEYRAEYYGCPCGQIVYQKYAGEQVHVYGPWTEVWVKTCSVKVLKRECIDCGAEHEEGWFAPSHSMGLWQIETYPTCTDGGTFYRRCAECGEREEHSSEPYGHSFDSWQVVKEPTCQEEGERSHACRYCQQTEQETIPGIDHQWGRGVVTVEPTWTKDGELTFTCLHCGEKKIEPLSAIGEGPCDGGENCWSRTFTDVPPVGDWAHEGIDFAVGMGLFNGMSEDTFAPNRTMTRAMLVTVLWRYAGSPPAGENTFTDVEDGLWYTQAITWASEKAIVNGVGNHRFDPNGNVTREQLATILYRFTAFMGAEAGMTADLSTYPDGETVSPWAAEAMAWAVEEGLIRGIIHNGETLLTPKGAATRAQVATILMRYMEKLPT